MRFSLIVATIGRTAELERLLDSLARQSHRDFEVIVIDQNGDDRLMAIIEAFRDRMALVHLRATPGLSRARNIGLAHFQGGIVAFPDDDCWYPPETLSRVARKLSGPESWDGVIGHSVDEKGEANLPWRDRAGRLSPAMCWRRAVTYTFFLPGAVVRQVGGFDETLGPGAGTLWGCGEDNDYLLRVLAAGYRVFFDPELLIHHPKMFLGFDRAARDKKYRYSLGDGRLLRKHSMPLWWKALFFGVPLARIVAAAHRFSADQVKFHWATFKGRLRGYLSRLPPSPQQNSTQFIQRTREKP